MKAVIHEKYGSPDLMRYMDVEKPVPKDDEVLVKIHASSINYGDNAMVRGKPFIIRIMGNGFFKPKHRILGGDLAVVVESVGDDVTQFNAGDEVYADVGESGLGAYAEYLAVPEKLLALKPVNLTFEEASTIPQAAVVALQSLRKGGIKSGHKVLINGASGGVGSFAVQIAKSLGAEVTGVCSTRNVELVCSLGADHVIDYTKENFTENSVQYNLIVDVTPSHSFSDTMNSLSSNGVYVSVAFNVRFLLNSMVSKKGGRKVIQLTHDLNVEDLIYLKDLIEEGKVTPVIDRIFPLSETSAAFRYYEDGRTRGKVVISMEHESTS